jgi:putative ABC transport system permease protein
VWVDAQLLDALAVNVGDTLLLGSAQFRIGALIASEPDRGAGFMNFAPRVMMNAVDVAATALVQPASRVNYRLAVAGEEALVARFVAWGNAQIKGQAVTKGAPAQAQPMRGVRMESTQSGRPELSQTLERAEKFLSLVALLAALLSGVAVALAARAFAAKHLDDCAMLRVLGLSQRSIAASYAWEFALVGVFASSLGVALGYGVHYVFVMLLAGLVETSLPAASLAPVGLGLGMGLTLLCAFGLPPVLQLAQVPPLRVIRRDVGNLRPASLGVLSLGVLGFAALLLAVSSDLALGLIAVGGFACRAVLHCAADGFVIAARDILRVEVMKKHAGQVTWRW